HGPAASDRSATETGASAFVVDPTRMSPGSGGTVRSAADSATSGQPLVVDAERREGPRQEALVRDLLPAPLANTECPVVEADEGTLDLRQRLLRALLEPFAELSLERLRRRVGTDAPRHSELLLHRPRAVLAKAGDHAEHTRALAFEEIAELRHLSG